MIKIENDIYYMTAGETCMILKNDGGTLKNIYFGNRVELEDDLSALGYGSIETEETVAVGDVPLRIVGATVLDEKPSFATGLDGGKTLVISMRAESVDVTADVYYTPYTRGGFARRTVVTNNGGKPIKVNCCNNTAIGDIKELVWISADGKTAHGGSTDKKARCVDNFLAATAFGSNAYGFLCAYGDGVIEGKTVNGVAYVTVSDGASDIVKSGEEYVSPEMLAVFSNIGIDGMSRVLHDILRGGMNAEYLNVRRPIVLFCPDMPEKKTAEAAAAASELGCDVFAADVGAVTRVTLDSIVKACREVGIKPGISISPDRIDQNSVIVGACVKTDGEYYSADLCSEKGADALLSALSELIEKYDIEYLMIDLPRGGLGKRAKAVCRLRRALAEKFGGLFAEWGIVPAKNRDGRLLCYPPCLTRNVVELSDEISLKTAFDTATIGCLGYRIDPLSVTADIKRAVRAQIFSYQDDAPTVMLGDMYRSETDGCKCVACVTKDKSRAYVVCVTDGKKTRAELNGLDEHNLYHVRELNKTFSGAALMAIGVPIDGGANTFCLHIRQVADYE